MPGAGGPRLKNAARSSGVGDLLTASAELDEEDPTTGSTADMPDSLDEAAGEAAWEAAGEG